MEMGLTFKTGTFTVRLFMALAVLVPFADAIGQVSVHPVWWTLRVAETHRFPIR